jgi:uncharacterized membrane protein YfcA
VPSTLHNRWVDPTLSLVEAVALLLAGAAAGTINAVVGSGTLVTFPLLLAFGYPPVVANVTNTVGLFAGSFSGAWTYRRDLAGHGRRLLPLSVTAVLGGLAGGGLLLSLPPGAFRAIVPALIGLALVLVVVQPWLARALDARSGEGPRPTGVLLVAGVFGTSVYGGYFGAAQGVLLLGVLGVLLSSDLVWVNGVKNLLAGFINGVAALLFVATGSVAWTAALLLAVGSVVGGLVGGRWGRRLPATVLRVVIVVVGLAALVALLV